MPRAWWRPCVRPCLRRLGRARRSYNRPGAPPNPVRGVTPGLPNSMPETGPCEFVSTAFRVSVRMPGDGSHATDHWFGSRRSNRIAGQPERRPVMSEPILYEAADGVARITLNRPDVLNAITPELITAFGAAIERAGSDEAIRAVLVTGAGRGFCAGADLNSSGSPNRKMSSGELLRTLYHPAILGMRNMPKPIVTAVNGVAAGAGMSIALAGDIILAAQSASFLQAFSRI